MTVEVYVERVGRERAGVAGPRVVGPRVGPHVVGTRVVGRPGGAVLLVPAASLVMLAGLPGAGKTTLLRTLTRNRQPAAMVTLDSEDVAILMRPLPVPYRVLRPVVHAVHIVRVVRAAATPAACVLATDPMSSPVRRLVLYFAARLTGRSLDLVVVDATLAEAVDGQRRRGRALGRHRMARHDRRWGRLRQRRSIPWATSSIVVDRAEARSLTGVEVRAALGKDPSPKRIRLAAARPGGVRSRVNAAAATAGVRTWANARRSISRPRKRARNAAPS